MKKRNMSLILVLALILCLIPATAFADNPTTWSGDITDNKTVTDTVTVDGTVNIKANVTVTSGKIIVPDGAKLIIKGGWLWLNDSSYKDADPELVIEEGGELVVNNTFWTQNDFGSDVDLGGKITVTGNSSGVITNYGTGRKNIVGRSADIYKLYLDSTAVATITSLGETSADGYKYVISGGTATTNNFTNSGKDELVVADGATLDATAGMTLDGTSTKQLTVENGGTLKLPSDTTTAQAILESAYGEGDQKITSGTYSLDPSKVGTTPTSYVATGYKVVDNKDNTWTVTPKGYLSKIAVTVKEPVVGETPASTFTSTVKEDGSATPAKNVVWFKMSKAEYEDTESEYEWKAVGENEKFQKDYYYACVTYFTLNAGFEVSDDLDATVNGKDADEAGLTYQDGVVGVAKFFGPLAEKSPVTGDNNELGLFAVAGLISALGVALMLRRKHSM